MTRIRVVASIVAASTVLPVACSGEADSGVGRSGTTADPVVPYSLPPGSSAHGGGSGTEVLLHHRLEP